MNKLKERFKKLSKLDWVEFACCFLVFVILLYFSIGMSISLAKGLTLFGDSSNTSNSVEIEGPTTSDVIIITLMWVLTVLLLLIWAYMLFFKKPSGKLEVTKEVVNNKIVEMEEEKKTEGLTDSEFLSSLSKLEKAEKTEELENTEDSNKDESTR